MAFQLTPLPSGFPINTASFLRRFQFGNWLDERGYVAQVVKRASNGQNRVHVLFDEDRAYGFAAIYLSTFNKKPSIVLEYLFAAADQRGVHHRELEDLTVGEFLLQYCLKQAQVMNDSVPVSYFSLEPADQRLVRYYRDKDFELVDKTGWMFVSI